MSDAETRLTALEDAFAAHLRMKIKPNERDAEILSEWWRQQFSRGAERSLNTASLRLDE